MRQVRRLAARADVRDIDGWFRRILKQLTKLLAAAWRAIRDLTGMWLEDHAAAEGRTVEPTFAQWNTEQVLTNMRVTGPVAFKTAIAAGKSETQARAIMVKRMSGSALKVALRADRETVMATVRSSDEIVGYRRVSDGDPCWFCAMLITRGAVYKSEFSATRVVGRRGVARGNQKLGEEFHDWCGCTSEALYEGEEEPPEVVELQKLWDDVTDDKSADEKANAWREFWENRERPAPGEPPSPLPDVPPVSLTPEPEPGNRYHRSFAGIEDLAAIVADVDDSAERQRLAGGMSANVELVKLADGRVIVHKRALDWGDPDEVAESVRHQSDAELLAPLLARVLGAPVARVYRTEDDAVWMEFIAGTFDTDNLLDSDDAIRLGLLDMLSANGDRNSLNMLERGGRLVGIDHGFNWSAHMMADPRLIPGRSDRPSRHYADEFDLRDNPLTPHDVDVLRERLETLRPDFAHVGREDWLDYSLRALARLRPHARGSEPLYG